MRNIRAKISTQTSEEVLASQAVAAQFKRGKHSAPRPGQPPQTALHRSVIDLQQALDLDEEHQADDDGPSSPAADCVPRPLGQSPPGPTHAEKVLKLANNWTEKREQHTDALRSYEELKLPHRRDYEACVHAHMKHRMLDSAQQHNCCRFMKQATPVQVSERPVTYQSLDVSVELLVPTLFCALCGVKWEMSACSVGCFPSSPVVPQRWFSASLHNMYQLLASKGGVSSTDFAACLQHVHKLAGQEVDIDDT